MKKEQLQQYLDNLKFGVKDFNKTYGKWAEYRKDDYKKIMENSYHIENHLNELEDDIEYHLYDRSFYYDIIKKRLSEAFETGKGIKTAIRELKTYINYTTITVNKNTLESLLDQDEIPYTKNNGFAITFYMNNYEQINQAMHNVLSDIVLSFNLSE